MSPTPASLTATYNGPTAYKTFASALPAVPTSASTEDKTAFIAALRANVSQMQDDMNLFLTQKMDEDKAREADAANTATAAARGAKRSALDEAREEEMYGEEVVDED